MPLEIPDGHKFAAIAFENAGTHRNLRREIGFGDGARVLIGAPFDLDDAWRTWLGSIQTENLTRTTLTLAIVAPSQAPGVIDAETKMLEQRMLSLFYALNIVGIFYYDSALMLSGARNQGQFSVRSVSRMEPMYRPPGAICKRVDEDWLAQMNTIAGGVYAMHNGNLQFSRLRRGFHTWIGAMQEYYGGDRLHQFVRAVEALVKPEIGRSKRLFVHRAQLFAGNTQASRELLGELYDFRSLEEHLNPIDTVLAKYPAEQHAAISAERSFQAQVLASSVYRRIFEDPRLREAFASDDLIDTFWRETWDNQVAAWARPVDLIKVATNDFRRGQV